MLRVNFQLVTQRYVSRGAFRRKFNAIVQAIGLQTSRELQPQLVAIFGAPGPVVYPIEWVITGSPPAGKRANIRGGLYSKQKAAYFATNGFGRGIPSKRSGKTALSWKVIYVAASEGGELILLNTEEHAKYIYGDFEGKHQQPFHKNTGYKSAVEARAVLLAAARTLAKAKFAESLGSFGMIDVELRGAA